MTTEWCDRNWHDGTCCPGSIRQWHLDRDLVPPDPGDDWDQAHEPCRCGLPESDPAHVSRYVTGLPGHAYAPEPHGLDTTAAGWSWAEAHGRGDHSACNRNCEHTL
jgi:hypothetical protein